MLYEEFNPDIHHKYLFLNYIHHPTELAMILFHIICIKDHVKWYFIAWRGRVAAENMINQTYTPYSLDQTLLSISRRSGIVATPLEVLNETVATLE